MSSEPGVRSGRLGGRSLRMGRFEGVPRGARVGGAGYRGDAHLDAVNGELGGVPLQRRRAAWAEETLHRRPTRLSSGGGLPNELKNRGGDSAWQKVTSELTAEI